MTRPTNAPHPGQVLYQKFMEPMRLSTTALGLDLHVPPQRISDICRCKRSVTPETAAKLGRYFGQNPRFWMDLQADYDLDVYEEKHGDEMRSEVRPRASLPPRVCRGELIVDEPEPAPVDPLVRKMGRPRKQTLSPDDYYALGA